MEEVEAEHHTQDQGHLLHIDKKEITIIKAETIRRVETDDQDTRDHDHDHNLHGDQGQNRTTDIDMKTNTTNHDPKAHTGHHVEVKDVEFNSIRKRRSKKEDKLAILHHTNHIQWRWTKTFLSRDVQHPHVRHDGLQQNVKSLTKYYIRWFCNHSGTIALHGILRYQSHNS